MYRLQKDLAKMKILEFAAFTPGFSKRDLTLAFTGEGNRSMPGNALSGLLKYGFIETVPRTDNKYFRISGAGKEYLQKENEYFRNAAKDGWCFAGGAMPTEIKNSAARIRVWCGVRAAGVLIYPADKPAFEDLAINMNRTLEREYRIQPGSDARYRPLPAGNSYAAAECLERGIYYTMDEIRRGCDRLAVKSDTFRYSRCAGVLFTRNDIFVLYHTGTTAIKWTDVSENALLDMLRNIFSNAGQYTQWYRYSNALNAEKAPVCLFFGAGWAAAATLATGYISGKKEKAHTMDEAAKRAMEELTGAELERYKRDMEEHRIKDERITAKRRAHSGYFSALNNSRFREIYYVPLQNRYMYMLKEILEGGVDKLQAQAKQWFSHTQGYIYSSGLKGCSKSDRISCLYMPVMECITLSTVKDDVTVITDRNLAGIVSLILGRRLAGIRDMVTGEAITGIPEYDDFGYEIPQKEVSDTVFPKGGSRSTDPETHKKTISISVTPEMYKFLQNEKKKSGQSMTDTVCGYLEKGIGTEQAAFDDLPAARPRR